MLKLGGYINIIIAAGHIIGLLWAEEMFEVTGIGREMAEFAVIHSLLPYLITIFVATVFLLFGLYGLSGAGVIKRLPFLRATTFTIAGIYFLRGFGELLYDLSQQTNSITETLYSMIAVLIGFLFFLGGLKIQKIAFRQTI